MTDTPLIERLENLWKRTSKCARSLKALTKDGVGIAQAQTDANMLAEAIAIFRGEGWRPIESAPRDGAYIDIWRSRPHADVALGHRVPGVCWVANPENWIEPESPPGWYLEHDEEPLERVDGPEWKVSHFRPLPAPPEGGER